MRLAWGMAGQIKVREMRLRRYQTPLVCWIAGPFRFGTVLLRRCGDERDGLLPTRYVLGRSRMSSDIRVL